MSDKLKDKVTLLIEAAREYGADASLETANAEMDAQIALFAALGRKDAEYRQSCAEVERLRGIIRKAEFINAEFHGDGVLCDRCAICGVYAMDDGHTEDCPFYQWEGGAQ